MVKVDDATITGREKVRFNAWDTVVTWQTGSTWNLAAGSATWTNATTLDVSDINRNNANITINFTWNSTGSRTYMYWGFSYNGSSDIVAKVDNPQNFSSISLPNETQTITLKWCNENSKYATTITYNDPYIVLNSGSASKYISVTVSKLSKIKWYAENIRSIWDLWKITIFWVKDNEFYLWETTNTVVTGDVTLWNAVGFIKIWDYKIPYYL